LLKEAKKINDVSEDKLIEYTDTMVRIRNIKLDYLSHRNVNPKGTTTIGQSLSTFLYITTRAFCEPSLA